MSQSETDNVFEDKAFQEIAKKKGEELIMRLLSEDFGYCMIYLALANKPCGKRKGF